MCFPWSMRVSFNGTVDLETDNFFIFTPTYVRRKPRHYESRHFPKTITPHTIMIEKMTIARSRYITADVSYLITNFTARGKRAVKTFIK